MTTDPSSRRIGAADSKTRVQLLDAAEKLLLDEGYAAVTSRRVGARAGLKPQLVHYYFRTMDDLYLEVFRRHAERGLKRFKRALGPSPSLSKIWKLSSDAREARFVTEFAALANHRKAIRAELATYAEKFRAAQLEVLTQALREQDIPESRLPPIAALLVMMGVGQIVALEEALGFGQGHQETLAFMDTIVAGLEQHGLAQRGLEQRGSVDPI